MDPLKTIIAKLQLNSDIRNQQESNSNKKEQKRKGLEFMAIRYNLADRKRKLRINKEVTPAEYYLLEEIELATVGARNSKCRICSKHSFVLNDLSAALGYKTKMKLWKLLKSLEEKKLIIREKITPGVEILGLNPEEYGQILIDKEHTKEGGRAHLRLVENF